MISTEPGTGEVGEPPRAVLLCNVDDDDEDGSRDFENAEIDGNGDADDLARITISLRSHGPASRCELRLESTDDRLDAAVESVRIFDEEGVPRLGRGAGTTWTLDASTAGDTGRDEIRLFAEGCAFASRAHLIVQVDDGAPERVVLDVAPLLIAPPTGAIDAVWICDDDNLNTKAFYESFVDAYRAAFPNAHSDQFRTIDLSSREYGRDFWIQDELQWAYTETPFAHLPVAIHLPRGLPLEAWVEDRLEPDVGYVRPCAPTCDGAPTTDLAYGGNLEPGVAPDARSTGCIYHGFTPGSCASTQSANDSLDDLRSFLNAATAQSVLSLDTTWLRVGHVDELLTMVGRVEMEGDVAKKVHVTLLVASPGEGVWRLEQIASQPVPKAFGRKYGARLGEGRSPDPTWRDFLEAPVSAQSPSLRQYNLDLEKRIFGDPNDVSKPGVIEPLVQALRAAALEEGVDPPKTVKVPTFFRQADSNRKSSSSQEDEGANEEALRTRAVAMVPNMINLVALEGHLFVPDPLVEGMRAAFEQEVDQRGAFEVHWIPVFDFLHQKGGGVHCATNARYAPPETPQPQEEER